MHGAPQALSSFSIANIVAIGVALEIPLCSYNNLILWSFDGHW